MGARRPGPLRGGHGRRHARRRRPHGPRPGAHAASELRTQRRLPSGRRPDRAVGARDGGLPLPGGRQRLRDRPVPAGAAGGLRPHRAAVGGLPEPLRTEHGQRHGGLGRRGRDRRRSLPEDPAAHRCRHCPRRPRPRAPAGPTHPRRRHRPARRPLRRHRVNRVRRARSTGG
ncbi:hypothetical protein MICRO11B_120087 [Micrococcus luteus]|nr:hypothetical protein MICRO11B_120087 [Micrococcus luteus]